MEVKEKLLESKMEAMKAEKVVKFKEVVIKEEVVEDKKTGGAEEQVEILGKATK